VIDLGESEGEGDDWFLSFVVFFSKLRIFVHIKEKRKSESESEKK